MKYFIGIDIGTQGARTVLLSSEGELIAEASKEFILNGTSREEQSPTAWWEACLSNLRRLMNDAKLKIDLRNISAVGVTSTSGTVIPIDSHNLPLHNAIMYSDPRSAEAAKECTEAALHHFGNRETYKHFTASSGLSKIVWFAKKYPEKAQRIYKWIHASDYVTGKLCGIFDVTDYTNALKSGYDIEKLEWPSYLTESLLLKPGWLQKVVPTGTPIGLVEPGLIKRLGLPGSVRVIAGMTDGCASQVASGAVEIGDWNTTIGTTMVIKGVTSKPISDPLGRLYNHRHPSGYWMPGGASNTGADWVTNDFGTNLKSLNDAALGLFPTGRLAWPLKQRGERFPFISPEAEGFYPGSLTKEELFTANMEGVAYIERYAYEMISSLSGETVNTVFTAGGASNSEAWLRIRSNVLNRPIVKMKYVSGGVGAAILAASHTSFHSLKEAVKSLTITEEEVHPDARIATEYNSYYRRFLGLLKEKGYIESLDF